MNLEYGAVQIYDLNLLALAYNEKFHNAKHII